MVVNEQPVTLLDCIASLEARRQWLAAQLNTFTKPVAACDADYNAILAERAEIVRALSGLRPIARGEARVPHPREDH